MSADKQIRAVWQPSASDGKWLRRHIILRRLRLFVPTQGSNIGLSCFIWVMANHIPILKTLPAWVWLLGWPTLVILGYILSTRRLIYRSVVNLSWTRAVTISGDQLTVEYAGNEPEDYRLAQLTMRRRAEGIYIDLAHESRFVPLHAFASEEDAARFEYIFVRYRETANNVRIPPASIDGFPVAITYQPHKWDAAYAYYHGWARMFVRSEDSIVALAIFVAPSIICPVIGIALDSPVASNLPVGLSISGILGVIIALYMASPAFPLSVAQRRYPWTKVYTVALGKSGIAVHDGREQHVHEWKSIGGLSSDHRCIYLSLNKDLIIIPKSAFLDSRHAGEFLAVAQAYQRGETPALDTIAAAWPPAPEVM